MVRGAGRPGAHAMTQGRPWHHMEDSRLNETTTEPTTLRLNYDASFNLRTLQQTTGGDIKRRCTSLVSNHASHTQNVWVRAQPHAQVGRACLCRSQSELECAGAPGKTPYAQLRAAATRGTDHKRLKPWLTLVFMSTTRVSCAMPKVSTCDWTTRSQRAWAEEVVVDLEHEPGGEGVAEQGEEVLVAARDARGRVRDEPGVAEDAARHQKVRAYDVDDRPHDVEELPVLVLLVELLERGPHDGRVLELAGFRQAMEQEGWRRDQRRDEPRLVIPHRALAKELAPQSSCQHLLEVEPEHLKTTATVSITLSRRDAMPSSTGALSRLSP
eukprot:scaffold27511_cov60-Phaeocystis_antarctica.AAC.2